MITDKIKIDDFIANTIVDNIDIFKNIDPNWITMSGMMLNFGILYNLVYDDNKINLGIILFLRWLADCLDGAVARKYKKTSKLGLKLDTLSDMMFYIIILYWLWVKIDNKIFCLIISVIWILLIYNTIFTEKLFDTHNNIKQGGTPYKSLIAFLVNNSYLVFIFIFYLNNNIDNANKKISFCFNNILNKIKINI